MVLNCCAKMETGKEPVPWTGAWSKRGLNGAIVVKRAEYSLGRKSFVEGNARQSGGTREKKSGMITIRSSHYTQ